MFEVDVVELDADKFFQYRLEVVDDLLLHVSLRNSDDVVIDDEQDDHEIQFSVDVEVGFFVLRMKS